MLPPNKDHDVELYNNCEKIISFYKIIDAKSYCDLINIYKKIVEQTNISLEFEVDRKIFLIEKPIHKKGFTIAHVPPEKIDYTKLKKKPLKLRVKPTRDNYFKFVQDLNQELIQTFVPNSILNLYSIEPQGIRWCSVYRADMEFFNFYVRPTFVPYSQLFYSPLTPQQLNEYYEEWKCLQ